MNIRRVTSLTAFISFFFMLLTSIVLYIVPQGRVAYWADWRLWGMSKEQWGAIHINTGLLFLLALLLHIYYNWKPITVYLKNKTRQWRIFTREFNVSLALVAVFMGGTVADIPPFSTVISFSDDIKAAAARKYGEPPYGHAELSSLKSFSQKTGLDLEKAVSLLKASGYRVESETAALKDIAAENGVSPQVLYQVMTDAPGPTASVQPPKMPTAPPPGTGNLTLNELCRRYGLEPASIVNALSTENIRVDNQMTIKEAAAANGMGPVEIYERIRSISGS